MSNSKIHTVLIGTSKSQKDEDKYFYEGANIKRFWGTLSKVNNNFKEEETKGKKQTKEEEETKRKKQTKKLISTGVFFKDISSAKGEEEKRDKSIKAISLKKGFEELEELFRLHPDIQRIGFIGKQAAKWFFIRFIDKIKLHNGNLTYKEGLFKYGKQEWQIVFGNKEIECFVLTNTARQWDQKVWIEFWKDVF